MSGSSFRIPTNHSALPEALDISELRFISIFQNQHGEQLIFTADWTSGAGQIAHADDGWRIHEVSRDSMYPPLILTEGEETWLLACWTSVFRQSAKDVAKKLFASRLARDRAAELVAKSLNQN